MKRHYPSIKPMDPSYKSHSVLDKYPTMHILYQKYTHMHIILYKMMHCGICHMEAMHYRIWDWCIVRFVQLIYGVTTILHWTIPRCCLSTPPLSSRYAAQHWDNTSQRLYATTWLGLLWIQLHPHRLISHTSSNPIWMAWYKTAVSPVL